MDPLIGLITGGFALGLASTLHCAGMCGGIASGLLHVSDPRTSAEGARLVALTNAGRIASYSAAGAIVGALGAPAVAWLDRELAFRLLQWSGAVAMMWIGLSTAGLLPSLSVLDRVFSPLAAILARAAKPRGHRYATALLGGCTWGLMPCAMVYGALFMAMLSGSALGGAAIMSAFGAGTLPGLLASVVGFSLLSKAGDRRRIRFAAGLLIAAFGFLTVWLPHKHADAICIPAQEPTALTWINAPR